MPPQLTRKHPATTTIFDVSKVIILFWLFAVGDCLENIKIINSTKNAYFITEETIKEIAAAVKPQSLTTKFDLNECFNTNSLKKRKGT